MLKLYNTLTRKKETFRPVKKEVRMYVCGPTVYGLIHIGNSRTFMTFDILYRYLRYKGFKVKDIQNITDVGHLTDIGEDKIMKGAAQRKMDPFSFVNEMIKEYFSDLKLLNIQKPKFVRATEHINDMIKVIQTLLNKGYAYVSDGYVYYDISKFKDYGKLSGQKMEELKKQRIEPHPKKRNPGDFALWIPAPKDYPMKWKSPWSEGFPGWHIECSTMSSKYLGLPIDIHGGGKDLIFPHHEDEIAQAEAATGKKFVNYWMHSEFILIDGKKMSKSLGNIITARDAAKKYGPRALRYFLMASHYRTEINLTEKNIKAAQKTVERLLEFMNRLEEAKENGGEYNKNIATLIDDVKNKFEEAMDDDLNMPLALSHIHTFISNINKYIANKNFNKKNIKEIQEIMLKFDSVLGLQLKAEKIKIPDKIKKLLEKREEARKKKNFKEADEIRKQILDEGYIIEDTEKGPRVKLK